MRPRMLGPFTLVLVSTVLAACGGGDDQERIDVADVAFDIPPGWSRLSASELEERGADIETMIGSADRDAIAFAMELRGVPALRVDAATYCPGAPAPLAALTAGLERGLEHRYTGYRLLGRRATTLGGAPAIALEYVGAEPGEPTRWRHLEVALPGDGTAMMFGLGCPEGDEDAFADDLALIRSSLDFKGAAG